MPTDNTHKFHKPPLAESIPYRSIEDRIYDAFWVYAAFEGLLLDDFSMENARDNSGYCRWKVTDGRLKVEFLKDPRESDREQPAE